MTIESDAEEASVIWFWSRTADERTEVLRQAQQHQAGEHAAAVRRIVEQARRDESRLPDAPLSILAALAAEGFLDEIADGVYRGPKPP